MTATDTTTGLVSSIKLLLLIGIVLEWTVIWQILIPGAVFCFYVIFRQGDGLSVLYFN